MTYKRLEESHDTGGIFRMTRQLLGWSTGGPPTCFKIGGWELWEAEGTSNLQTEYYSDKVTAINNSLLRVNYDSLEYLKRSFERWHPARVFFFFRISRKKL